MGGGEEERPGPYLPTKQSLSGSQGATKALGVVLCLPAVRLTTKLDNVLGKAPHPPQPPHSGFVPMRRHSSLSSSTVRYQSVWLGSQPGGGRTRARLPAKDMGQWPGRVNTRSRPTRGRQAPATVHQQHCPEAGRASSSAGSLWL